MSEQPMALFFDVDGTIIWYKPGADVDATVATAVPSPAVAEAFHALRQNRPVGVEDLATPSLQRHRDGAALRGGLCHVLAVDQLHIGQLDQACAGQNRQYDADGHGLRQQVPVEYRVDASDELH